MYIKISFHLCSLLVLLHNFLVSSPLCLWDEEEDNKCLGHTDPTVEDEEAWGAHDGDDWMGCLDSHEDHEELVADQDHRHQQLHVSEKPFSFQKTQNYLKKWYLREDCFFFFKLFVCEGVIHN